MRTPTIISQGSSVTRDELQYRLNTAKIKGFGHIVLEDSALIRPLPLSGYRPAAVLMLIVNRETGPTMLFTQRTAHLTDHAGQISFPGGRVEEHDANVEATALRETNEETGLDVSCVEILVTLPEYKTVTGYIVTPVVGWVEPPAIYQPDPEEVEECFEVPLDFILDVRNHKLESAMFKGRERTFHKMPYGEYNIWGVTAAMLDMFVQALKLPA